MAGRVLIRLRDLEIVIWFAGYPSFKISMGEVCGKAGQAIKSK